MNITQKLLILAAISGNLIAQQVPSFPVQSDFDGDPDGWASSSSDLVHFDRGGSPYGWLGYEDQDSGSGWAIAPAKFLGNWSSLDEAGYINFDFKIIRTGNGSNLVVNPYRVQLTGPNGGTATWERQSPGTVTDWKTFRAIIRESDWVVEGPDDWATILSNVTDFRIKVEMFGNSGGATEKDRNGLDNVALVKRSPDEDCPELQIQCLPIIRFATDDNAFYRLECSSDGEDWRTLATFVGTGAIQYFSHPRLLGKRKLYRLVCEDEQTNNTPVSRPIPVIPDGPN